MDTYLDQFIQYHKLFKALKKLKSSLRSNRYKANIVKISNYFMNKDYIVVVGVVSRKSLILHI